MNKLNEIATSWKNVVVNDVEIKRIAKARKAICNTCVHKIKMDIVNILVCDLCYCPITGLTHSPINSCKEGKWEE